MSLHLLLRAAEDVPAPGDRGALYFAASSVIVALIGGGVAVWTTRTRPSQTSEAGAELPRELTGLFTQDRDRDAARIAELEDDVEVWMRRAYESGWRP